MATHRVALVITDLEIGGAELCLTDLVVRLDRNRFEPVVFCLGPEPAAVNRGCLPILAKAGVEVHASCENISNFPGVLLELRRRFVRLQPALVQTFLFHANIVGRLAAGGLVFGGWFRGFGSPSVRSDGISDLTAGPPRWWIATCALAKQLPGFRPRGADFQARNWW